MNFDSFNLDARILSGIRAQRFKTPTPIQLKSIPHVLSGKDLLGLAQTGTGKTAAYVLPILQKLVRGPHRKVRALILAPTRELVAQIEQDVRNLGRKTGLRSCAIFGGVGIGGQIRNLQRGVEVIVGCPGRLLDHINRETIDLSNLEMLVLDEADQMFDMGFLPSVRKILSNLPKSKQTMLFSATMPGDIRKFADQILSNPTLVQVGRTTPAATVSHSIYPLAHSQKTPVLLGLLKEFDAESILIFTRTKHRAKGLASKLSNAGFKVTSLQGNLSQGQRKRAMDGFRHGRYQILVATDIAARGIDISSISHVINFDIPETTEAYTHRIGRTGRASRSGDAITLVTPQDRSKIRAIERVLGKPLKRKQLAGFNYSNNDSGVIEKPREHNRRFRRNRPACNSNPRRARIVSTN